MEAVTTRLQGLLEDFGECDVQIAKLESELLDRRPIPVQHVAIDGTPASRIR